MTSITGFHILLLGHLVTREDEGVIMVEARPITRALVGAGVGWK